MHDFTRCALDGVEPWYVAYHDTEWGVPLHDECALFEFLILGGAQAGLSWSTILKKGVRIILDSSECLSDKRLHYRLLDESEMMLVIPAAQL